MQRQEWPQWPAVPLYDFPEFVRAEGVYMWTSDGTRILDASGQACVSNIGFGRREVGEAVATALTELTHALPIIQTPQRRRLVKRLRDFWLPEYLSRIHFSNSGSEAVETAIKLARLHHWCSGSSGKWKVIGVKPSYHGATLAALAAGGHERRKLGLDPLLLEFPQIPACYPLRCTLCVGSKQCTLACANQLQTTIEREGADTVAAFIAEPIIGTSGGALVPTDGYWSCIQEICQRNDVLLIVDEVLTGFGRTGKRLAIDHWAVEPDILILAKGLTGGYAALSAVAATESVIWPLLQRREDIMFHTYGGHPSACAAANAVLEVLEREHLVDRVTKLGDYISDKVNALECHPNIAQFRGKGLLWAVEVVKDKSTLEPFPVDKNVAFEIVRAGLSHGVYFYPGGTGVGGAIVALGPAFVVTTDEIDVMLDVLRQSIDEVIGRIAALD